MCSLRRVCLGLQWGIDDSFYLSTASTNLSPPFNIKQNPKLIFLPSFMLYAHTLKRHTMIADWNRCRTTFYTNTSVKPVSITFSHSTFLLPREQLSKICFGIDRWIILSFRSTMIFYCLHRDARGWHSKLVYSVNCQFIDKTLRK